MPRIDLVSSNKQVSMDQYPRLKMKTGETALANLFDPQPEVEFVHTLRKPVFNPDGSVAIEIKQTRKKEDYESTVLEFVGMHRCFGNFDTLSEVGVDVNNCPTCKASKEGRGIDAPARRYAMHIIKYGMSGNKLRTPFGVEVQAWTFSNKKFEDLVDLAERWGDLRNHDIALKCISEQFQNIEMSPLPDAAWRANDERKALTTETFKQNRHPNLSDLIGRSISKDQAEDDIANVQRAVAKAQGRDVPDPLSERTANIDADVSNLLGESNANAKTDLAGVYAVSDTKVDPWADTTVNDGSAQVDSWEDLFKDV